MAVLSNTYCGIWRYFSNSASQASWLRGGIAPVTGRHSVIERPDPVRRVAPPTAIMTTTRIARTMIQSRSAAEWRVPDRSPRGSDMVDVADMTGGACGLEAELGF